MEAILVCSLAILLIRAETVLSLRGHCNSIVGVICRWSIQNLLNADWYSAKKESKRPKDAAVRTQGSMGVSSWNILYRFQLTISFYSALPIRCHLGLLLKGNLGVFPRPKGGTICSMSDFVLGSKSAGVLPALQYLKTKEDRRIFGVARRVSEKFEFPRLDGK